MRRLRAQPVGDGHQQAGRRSAVVGAHEVDVAQRVIGFVVRAEHDDARLRAGKAHDEVAQGHRADRRVGGERVFFKLIVVAEKMVAQKCLGLHVARAGGPARADGGELARVFVGLGAVEVLGGRERGRSARAARIGCRTKAAADPRLSSQKRVR